MTAWKSGLCLSTLLLCLFAFGSARGADAETPAAIPPPSRRWQPRRRTPPLQALHWTRENHAWMLVSSLLVLMMTAPGLALFYSGLVRKKNVLSVMMQCVALMGLMSVVWALRLFAVVRRQPRQ